MNSLIVIFYFMVFSIISYNHKGNIKDNKFLTYTFIYLSSSISIFITYFLYLYSEFHTVLPLIIGLNFIFSSAILIPILTHKKTYGNRLFKDILVNITQHMVVFFTFIISIVLFTVLSNINYILQIVALIFIEVLFVYTIRKYFNYKLITPLLGTVFTISFIILSIITYEIPTNYSYGDYTQNEWLGLYEILEYDSFELDNGDAYNIIIEDNFMYVITNDFSRLQNLEVYNLETNEHSIICTFEDNYNDNLCTNRLLDYDYAGGLNYYNGIKYFYSQNGLYYINDENILTLIILADDVSGYHQSLLYLEDETLIFESTISVYQIDGITPTLLTDRESLHSYSNTPFTQNLILIKDSETPGFYVNINGIDYSGFFKSNLIVYTESVFTGNYEFSSEYFISIDGIEYDLDSKPYGVLKIDNAYYVLNTINDSFVLINPVTLETISYIDESYFARYFVDTLNTEHFITGDNGNKYSLNEVKGFNGYTIVYEQARFYHLWSLLFLPIMTLIGYAMFYDTYEDEKNIKKTKT